MITLSNLQKDFKTCLLQHALEESLREDSKIQKHQNSLVLSTTQYNTNEYQARLAIYKNNIYQSLGTNLKDLYPALVNSIGEVFFEALCKVFVTRHPPTERSLIFYGEALPKFLRDFEHTKNYPYLGDLALVDFYRHQAFHAQDQEALTAQEIQETGIETLAQSKIEFVDSLKLIDSKWSVFSLWQTSMDNEKNSKGLEINIEDKEHILIYRDTHYIQEPNGATNFKNYKIYTLGVDEGLYSLLSTLKNGHILADALEECLNKHENFDIASAVAFLTSHRFIHRLID